MKLFFLFVLTISLAISSCAPATQLSEPKNTPINSPTEIQIPVATAITEQPEASESTIGYPSVTAALADLQTRTDVSINVQGGWTIVTESDGLTTWSFAPPSDPAYIRPHQKHCERTNAKWGRHRAPPSRKVKRDRE